MNKCLFIGRLTKDPEVTYTQGAEPLAIAHYTLAVDRRFKKDGQPTADFPRFVAFGKSAEFAEKYFRKGMKVALETRVQTGSYEDKDGKTVYTTDFVVESQEFCESKGSNGNGGGGQATPEPATDSDGFMAIPDGIEEELPFN